MNVHMTPTTRVITVKPTVGFPKSLFLKMATLPARLMKSRKPNPVRTAAKTARKIGRMVTDPYGPHVREIESAISTMRRVVMLAEPSPSDLASELNVWRDTIELMVNETCETQLIALIASNPPDHGPQLRRFEEKAASYFKDAIISYYYGELIWLDIQKAGEMAFRDVFGANAKS